MPPPRSPRSSRSRVTSSTNSGTPPVRAATSSTTSRDSAWRAESSATMSRTWRAIERRQRDRAVMRAHAPGRPELGPSRRHDEQRRQRAALGDAAQHVERGRIGPMQILERQHQRLRLGAGHHPVGQRRQLPAAQLLGRQTSARVPAAAECRAAARARGAFSAGSSLTCASELSRSASRRCGRHVGAAEALPAPFGDRVQRRVLQKLRAAPFDPGVRRLGEPGMKFLDQARFAQARLADDQHQLAVALPRPLPAPHQHRRFPRRGRRAA